MRREGAGCRPIKRLRRAIRRHPDFQNRQGEGRAELYVQPQGGPIAFKDNRPAHTALMLCGQRYRDLVGWLEQTTIFYQNLLATPELMAGLARFGYTGAKLQAELELVKAVTEANQAQEIAKSKAVAATRGRDDKLAELERWLSEFKAIARIALAGSQMQQALGLSSIA